MSLQQQKERLKRELAALEKKEKHLKDPATMPLDVVPLPVRLQVASRAASSR